MNDKEHLNNIIKAVLNDSLSDIKISRDIFNEAWDKRESVMSKRRYFNMKFIRKSALIPVCCAVFAIVGIFAFSPEARVTAQEALKTIFLPDKSGNIVEESENTEVPVSVGPIDITDQNREVIENHIGFKFNMPKKIGEYSYEKIDDYVFSPSVVLIAEDVRYKDSKDVKNKLEKAIEDDNAYEELEKDYKLNSIISACYEDSSGHEFQLIPVKDSGKNKKDDDEEIVRKINIDGIECVITKEIKFNYNVKEDENGHEVTDLEHKPESSEVCYYMDWSYDGINYGLVIGKNALDIDVAVEFATDYIKILRQ